MNSMDKPSANARNRSARLLKRVQSSDEPERKLRATPARAGSRQGRVARWRKIPSSLARRCVDERRIDDRRGQCQDAGHLCHHKKGIERDGRGRHAFVDTVRAVLDGCSRC